MQEAPLQDGASLLFRAVLRKNVCAGVKFLPIVDEKNTSWRQEKAGEQALSDHAGG